MTFEEKKNLAKEKIGHLITKEFAPQTYPQNLLLEIGSVLEKVFMEIKLGAAPFEEKVDGVLAKVKALLLKKNAAYGNAALDPVRIFSKATSTEQIRVRIDDKLSRLQRGQTELIQEDTVLDILGYLVLLVIAEAQEVGGE